MAQSPRDSTGRSFPGSFPGLYPWLLLFASMDIAVTSIVLALGGEEVNAVADRALRAWGLAGLIIVKAFSLVVLIACCEAIARARSRRGQRTARGLAVASVAVTCFPVLFGAGQLLHAMMVERNPMVWEAMVLAESVESVAGRYARDADTRRMAELRRRRAAALAAQGEGESLDPVLEDVVSSLPAASAEALEKLDLVAVPAATGGALDAD